MTVEAPVSILDALEATWPPASTTTCGPFILRDGGGGGKRVSAATAQSGVSPSDVEAAAAEMWRRGQPRLFQVRDDQSDLDSILKHQGYRTIDPTRLYASPAEQVLRAEQRPLDAIASETRLGIQSEIWAHGGIGPARLAVMDRAAFPKTWILARLEDRAAGSGFASIHAGIVMVHALEVLPRVRRRGCARAMLHRAAKWAIPQGARTIALAVTAANEPANTLYASLGMRVAAQYHYRIHPEDTP